MPYYYVDYWYLILVVPAIIFSLIASAGVNSAFKKYSKVASRSGITGAESARRVLMANGVTGVKIESVAGNLTDHFDPKTNTIRLSENVYGASTVAAVGVAAHEAGHAVQYAVGYTPMKLRAAIIPATNIGAKISWPLILIGLLLSSYSLALLGVLAFGLSTLFQFITLFVEFDASKRAISAVEGMCAGAEEVNGTKRVLRAAALTYVAALAVSLANLLRLFIMINRRRD